MKFLLKSYLPNFKPLLKLKPKEALPDFLVIGTQKGGTTSLYQILKKHPDIFLPACKEVHYFTLNSEKPTSWYTQHYINAKKNQKLGVLNVYISGELHKKIDILSAEDIKRSNIFARLLKSLNYLVWGDA